MCGGGGVSLFIALNSVFTKLQRKQHTDGKEKEYFRCNLSLTFAMEIKKLAKNGALLNSLTHWAKAAADLSARKWSIFYPTRHKKKLCENPDPHIFAMQRIHHFKANITFSDFVSSLSLPAFCIVPSPGYKHG